MSEAIKAGIFHTPTDRLGRGEPREATGSVHLHPDDVLADPALATAEKRAILAGWISDRHAVPDQPGLRQLANGALVQVDEVLRALRALDAADGIADVRVPGPIPFPRHRRKHLPRRTGLRLEPDDDDDPPPAGAAAPIPALIPALAA